MFVFRTAEKQTTRKSSFWECEVKEVCCFHGLWIEEAQKKLTNTDYETIETHMCHIPISDPAAAGVSTVT